MKRVNIKLSAELHTKAKILSLLQGKTLNDYLAGIIEEAVRRDKKLLEKIPK